MSTRLLPAVAHLLTLVLACLLPVACRQPAAAEPTAGAPAPALRPNLLRNPDFHEGSAMWVAAPGVESAPLAIDPAGFAVLAAPGPAKSVAWSQSVPVQAEAAYYVACRVHSEGLAGCAWLGVGFRDAAGRLLDEVRLALATGDTDWAPRAWRCRAPTGAVQASVSFGVEGATSGRAAFDDLCLAPDDAPLTRALIVDWREEAGQFTAPSAPATVAGLATALAWAEAGRSPCPSGAPAVPTGGDMPVPSPAGQVLVGLRDTPRRLSTQGSDELGFTLLAGRSDDGCLAQVLIADGGSRSEAYRLALAGFPPGFHYSVAEVAAGGQLRLLREGSSPLNGLLMSPWRSPAVHLIRIWWQ